MPAILVIDDDPLIHHRIRRDFEESEVQVFSAQTAEEGLHALSGSLIDVVLLDVMLPDQPGLTTYGHIRDRHPQLPVIFITASDESDTVIEAMKLGAMDYLLKPLDQVEVRRLVACAIENHRLTDRRVTLNDQATASTDQPDVLIGRCPAMQAVYKAIGRVAPQNVTVLIQGESGTGKELVANAIYQHSLRANQPFLAINCAAIPENLLESELFGHEQGAFTGADRRRTGKFEQCDGGTLFLDEIGDMSTATQSKLLRVLQQQEFERVGGTETIRTNVRVVTATNRNLKQMVEEGRFRRDLFYRVNTIAIELPALRDRLSDIPLLLQHFLTQFSGQLNKPIDAISPRALDILMNYYWPGNVREFQSVLKYAMLHATGRVLIPEFFPETVRHWQPCPTQNQNAESPSTTTAWHDMIEGHIRRGTENLHAEMTMQMEYNLIRSVLHHTCGNKLQAAKILGLSRQTLRNRMASLGISVDQVVAAN